MLAEWVVIPPQRTFMENDTKFLNILENKINFNSLTNSINFKKIFSTYNYYYHPLT